MSALEEALAAIERGWPVFPCVPGAKRPATRNGLLAATLDPARVQDCWTKYPNHNLAVRTGEPSGLVVLDVDGQEGSDSLHELEAEHGALPVTRSVVTPRGGHHYYFQWPGVAIKSTASQIGDGLDIRGDSAYVLVPPSRTIAGSYEWDSTAPEAEMPQWLVQLTRVDDRPGGTGQVTPPDRWVTMIVDGIGDGSRNVDLARLTGYLLRRYVAVDLTAELVHLVNAQCCRPPKSAGEVDRIIDSISLAELRRREARS